jgi:hypothetical protein
VRSHRRARAGRSRAHARLTRYTSTRLSRIRVHLAQAPTGNFGIIRNLFDVN